VWPGSGAATVVDSGGVSLGSYRLSLAKSHRGGSCSCEAVGEATDRNESPGAE
jgi:hypothetical protein